VLASAGGSVFLLTRAGACVPLPSAGSVTLIAFTPGTHDVVVAGDGGSGVISDVTGQPAFRRLPAVEGFENPVALAVAPGGRALLANSKMVAAVRLDTGEAVTDSCSCTVTGLHPMKDGAIFRLNEPSGEPMWLLDAGSAELRLWFVPAATMP
jgi:hypothetical protein